jgi:pimeloyl-ACP methyl ester carboxylesterase
MTAQLITGQLIAARLITLILISSIVLAACATPTPTTTPSPTAQPDAPRFEAADCPFDEPLGQDVECGYLIVPEDRAQPGGKTIRLAVARFRSDSARPAPDPIVYLEGGPGGSPLRALIPQFGILFAPLLEKRDLILIDQRGTGYSQPALDCPEYKEWTLSALDQNLSAEQAEELGNQAMLECRERLASSGVNLAAYDSAANAADLDDLRRALGIEQWNLYGISYGTRLALTVLRDHPEGIRSIVIDSVVPLQADLYVETPANGARAFEVLFDACAGDSACNAAFPDLKHVLFDLVDRLNQSPATFPIRLKSGEKVEMLLNGDGLMGVMFQSLYATSVIPLLPRLIYEVRDGNYALAGALQSSFLSQLDDVSYGMHFSVNCEEEAPFNAPEQLEATRQQYAGYRVFGGMGIFDLCKAWGSPAAGSIEDQAVGGDAPALVLSGQFDPITPPAWGRLVAETLPSSFYFELPNAGHGASLTEDCPREMVLAFLDDPATPPDSACTESDMAALAFARPQQALEVKLAPFAEASMGLRGLAPEGWVEVAPGSYTPSGSLTDQTAVVQQAGPVAKDMLLRLLTAQIEQSGFQVEFEPAGSRAANGLEWSLYTAEASIASLDLALAEQGGVTYIVLLQALVDERAALYDKLFLPLVDALQPAGG